MGCVGHMCCVVGTKRSSRAKTLAPRRLRKLVIRANVVSSMNVMAGFSNEYVAKYQRAGLGQKNLEKNIICVLYTGLLE